MFIYRNRFLCAFLLSAAALLAQSEKATLRGTVRDTAGNPVGETTLVIIDAATDVTARSITTDDSGKFEATGLMPGLYRVTIDRERFQSYVAENLVLDPGRVFRFEPRLAAGSLADDTKTTETPPQGPPDQGQVDNIVRFAEKWQDAPVASLQPSLFPLLVTSPAVKGNGAGIVISGATRNQQTWAFDGVRHDATPLIEHPGFVDTVTVAISNPGVDSYRPVHFNAVTKRGADLYHGLISYQRGSAYLDARPYFDAQKPDYKSHQLEGQFGGPLIRGWTYFYAGWLTQKNPHHQTLYADVPTAQMRSLDFSQLLDPSVAPNGTVVVIRDPRTGVPFPNNRIPAPRLSLVAQKFLDNYYPAPNRGNANTFSQNYAWEHPFSVGVYRSNWPIARIDQRVSENNRAYFRWMQMQDASILPGSVGDLLTTTQTFRLRGLMVGDTHAFSSDLVNDFRLATNSIRVRQGEEENEVQPLSGSQVVSTVGLQGVNSGGYSVMGFPVVRIAGFTGMSTALSGGGTDSQIVRQDRIWDAEDTLTWSPGRHSVRFGFQYSTFRWYQGEVPRANFGAFNFTGVFSQNAFADFLLGLPATSTRQNARINRIINQKQTGLFLSDSFRIAPRLTLEYGVRWDYFESPEYDDGFMTSWDPSSGRVIVAPGTITSVSSLFPRSITVVAGQVVPKTATMNFRPRAALAYRLSASSALRAGYGQFTEHFGYGENGRLSGTNPYQLTETYTNSIIGGSPAISFPNPFPASPSSTQLPSQSVIALPQENKEGVIHQFNLTLERQTANTGIRASYIGMRGRGMNYTVDINKARAGAVPFSNDRRPYPHFANTYVIRDDGEWRYDSLVLAGRRRAGLLSLDSSFTWSNNRSNYANTIDPYNVTDQWTRDGADRRLYFVASAALPLPFGKGKGFGNFLIRNWTVQAIATWASGQYYSPFFTGPDPANATQGFVTQLPDCIGDPDAGARTIGRWFNPAAFAVPPATAGRYGNCAMNSLEGYPIHVGHVSFAKRLHVGERAAIVFTAQASNVTNTAHFTVPNNNLSNPNPGAFTASSVPGNEWAERIGPRRVFLKLRVEW